MSETGTESDDQLLSPEPESTTLTPQQQAASLPPPVVDPGTSRPSRSSSSSRDSRSRSSRRSRGHRSRSSGSRPRTRHRHSGRHRGRHNCRMLLKYKERNYAAASCSMIAIVLLCTSLEPDWIYLSGGGCHTRQEPEASLKQLSTVMFFYNGYFYKNYPKTAASDTVYKFGPGSNEILVNCVTYSSVLLFKTSIAFTIIAILCSCVAFLLDLLAPRCQLFKLLRRNAIFNIVAAVLCVTINLFVYWITVSVEELQLSTRLHSGSRVEVSFDASFYLVTAAGAVSVIATACNCLRKHNTYDTSESSRHSDPSYFGDYEALLPPSPGAEDAVSSLPPPPAYTP